MKVWVPAILKCVSAVLYLSQPLSATVFHEIDTTQLLRCTFSSKHHNRIAVDNGRVKTLMYPVDQLYVHTQMDCGQLFVQANELTSNPITISVVTDNELVQDIEVTFQDIAMEVVILKEPIDEPPTCNFSQSECDTGSEETPRRQIEAILKGGIPEEYMKRPFENKEWCLKRGVIGTTFLKLRGPVDTLYVFEVKNTTKRCQCIREKEIPCRNGNWIFLERNRIDPSEKIVGVISCHE